MTTLVEQIHQDHINAAKILDLIEKEVDKTRNENMPDLELLADAMRYMVNYADLIHHPKEDSIFGRLVRNDPDVADKVEALRQDHRTLAASSTAFLDIVKAAQSGEFILREEVVKRGTEYVDALRAHMDTEEQDLLERAEASLTKKDLEEIDAEYASARDPLMGESLEQEYGALHRSLFT